MMRKFWMILMLAACAKHEAPPVAAAPVVRTAPAPVQYEYVSVRTPPYVLQPVLNDFGSRGWELVTKEDETSYSLHFVRLTMKRAKQFGVLPLSVQDEEEKIRLRALAYRRAVNAAGGRVAE